MAQSFVGSNNVNLLYPSGQFGTRNMGGKDAASSRYIFTRLCKITRYDGHVPRRNFVIFEWIFVLNAKWIYSEYNELLNIYRNECVLDLLVILLKDPWVGGCFFCTGRTYSTLFFAKGSFWISKNWFKNEYITFNNSFEHKLFQ